MNEELTIAVHGVDIDVGGIGLGREAVVTNVDPGALDSHVLDIQRVEEISVLGKRSGVVGLGGAHHVAKGNSLGCRAGQQASFIQCLGSSTHK